jgi:hypothetical protein
MYAEDADNYFGFPHVKDILKMKKANNCNIRELVKINEELMNKFTERGINFSTPFTVDDLAPYMDEDGKIMPSVNVISIFDNSDEHITKALKSMDNFPVNHSIDTIRIFYHNNRNVLRFILHVQ